MTERTEDQKLPNLNSRAYSQDTLIDRLVPALTESKEIGEETYGTALQPFNGRDSFRDAFEELVDLAVYMENLRRERNEVMDILLESRNHAKLTQNMGLFRKINAALEGMGLGNV